VLVIDNGRLIERGTHDELLALGGFYHQLYMSQYRVVETAVFIRSPMVPGLGESS
jgi:ATP-binding cassette subfamily B protein